MPWGSVWTEDQVSKVGGETRSGRAGKESLLQKMSS